jgi:hypothetical protein
MSKSMISKSIFVFALAMLACRPALAAGHGRHIVLRPERHVIEVVHPPYSGSFIINGAYFTATSAACSGWTAGDRITLLAGDWHGRCIDAVFHNLTRHNACHVWCG